MGRMTVLPSDINDLCFVRERGQMLSEKLFRQNGVEVWPRPISTRVLCMSMCGMRSAVRASTRLRAADQHRRILPPLVSTRAGGRHADYLCPRRFLAVLAVAAVAPAQDLPNGQDTAWRVDRASELAIRVPAEDGSQTSLLRDRGPRDAQGEGSETRRLRRGQSEGRDRNRALVTLCFNGGLDGT